MFSFSRSQKADYFRQTVLKIEGDNVPAVEVAQQLEILKGNISTRQAEKYLDPASEAEKNRLVDNGYDEQELDDVFMRFYGYYLNCHNMYVIPFIHSLILNFSSFHSDDAIEYLLGWSEELVPFCEFSWVSLRSFPDWATVNNSMKLVARKTSFDIFANSSKVFEEYGYIKNYCSAEKMAEWNSENVSTEKRWVKIFKHMKANQVPFVEFSQIVEYILCFPGTSAPVERVFAKAKKVWKQESSALLVSTLKSILFVKINLDYECCEFYNFLRNQQALLRKIASQEKYDFKQPNPVDAASPGAMSVDFVEDDE